MTNKEEIFGLIQRHPEGLDDDELLEQTGIQPRQQIQHLCNQLANSRRIRRESVEKSGKRRKIHNFPLETARALEAAASPASTTSWERRLGGLIAATGRQRDDLLDEALRLLALRVLRDNHPDDGQAKPVNASEVSGVEVASPTNSNNPPAPPA